MTEQEYADIAAACDALLRAPSTNVARLAIPALHFLNEHPSSLAQYGPLLGERPDGGLSVIPRAVIRAARGLTRSLGAAPRPTLPDHRGPFDVVIVSHLLKAEQLQRTDDFYFGALQSLLRDRGATSLLVLVDHLRGGARAAPPHSEFPRLILPGTVPPATEANIWRQCKSTFRALRREASASNDSTGSRLAVLASEQALSAAATNNLRMHASLADICQAVNPRIVITTYEGTVAERLIWHAARTARRRPLCVGYQHALMLQRAYAIRRPVAAAGIDCDPDVILTLGEITHTALAGSLRLRSVPFIQYGSHRRATLPDLPQPQLRPRRCLVLPDADARECETLFDFALACAGLRPDVGFTLRPHPMVDTRALLDRRPALRQLPENVSLSTDKPLAQEFAQSRYCLYRGSSAAMHAVLAGLKPYYLARPGELSFDCLFGLPDWRETVTSPTELADSMTVADGVADSDAASRAMSFCERYVLPVRPAAIDELLAMATS